MAGVLPPDVVIRVLNPIVKTGEYPVNQAAIKMLTKVAEHESSKEIVVEHLADIMPGLLRVSIFFLKKIIIIINFYNEKLFFSFIFEMNL